MRRILRYVEGKAVWSENEPARARIASVAGITLSQALTEIRPRREGTRPNDERTEVSA